jgi:transposase-like protein
VPQDRNSEFEPKVVGKYQRDITQIEGKIIRMYARGMSTRQISDQIEEIYGFEVSEGMVTGITNKLLPEIEAWQKRPLSAVYPIVFIDAIVFNVKENNVIHKQAAYVILGISEEGQKEVLSITIGETESAKFWLSVLNELKNRGLKDIFVLCADGLSGIKEAIAACYPETEYQRCIVHVVRNTLKYVADKDKKAFANELKTIYHAADEAVGYARMQAVSESWNQKYPGSMKRWAENWDVISPMFKFSSEVRKVIYTTNAIESLNSGYRRLNRARSVFPSSSALLKALYLATFELTKKWTMPLRNWGVVYSELSIMYPGRMN